MVQDLALTQLLDLKKEGKLVLVDVRSPSEFGDATIPGSVNIPLFNDEERAEIGTIYKQVSPHAAKERGLEIVSAKLPAFIKSFAELPGQKAVFCWRGGMRSKTTATLLSLMDIRAYRLNGGYRAYRRWVVEQLNEMAANFKPTPYVLNGYTGGGKTEILLKLKEMGHPVLDLEGMAGHRGSIFGHIGLKSNNQKTFDALLMEELIRYENAPYVLFEAENKRIGKVMMPDPLVEKKEKAEQIWIDIPIKQRVQHILDDYRPWENAEACLNAFLIIKSRIHTPVAAEIEASLREGDFAKGVELLLTQYYDPRYKHSVTTYGEKPETIIRAASIEDATAQVHAWIEARKGKSMS